MYKQKWQEKSVIMWNLNKQFYINMFLNLLI